MHLFSSPLPSLVPFLSSTHHPSFLRPQHRSFFPLSSVVHQHILTSHVAASHGLRSAAAREQHSRKIEIWGKCGGNPEEPNEGVILIYQALPSATIFHFHYHSRLMIPEARLPIADLYIASLYPFILDPVQVTLVLDPCEVQSNLVKHISL